MLFKKTKKTTMVFASFIMKDTKPQSVVKLSLETWTFSNQPPIYIHKIPQVEQHQMWDTLSEYTIDTISEI